MKEKTIPGSASFGKVGRFLLLLGIILGAVSCSVEKKNAKAVDRVLGDINLVKKVRTPTDPLFPCVNDSVIISKTDTLTTYDTAYETKTDTVYTKDTAFRGTLTKVVTKTVRIRDTVKITVQDGREIKRLTDDLALATQRMISAQQGEIKAKDKADQLRKQRNTAYWILAAIAVLTGIVAYFKLKSKPLKAIINSGDIHKN